ncbi:LysR family transcriptional regulator [Actinocrispum wychmicini]|uniref:DNA-binding transcriptional LysR family regulator n=1 Tax=Actinocrispum wychmicini TaxID=1213861 RepID=A0A4R2JHE4_9PSEU|nr:LysR family transcriptional regulator [Actinocrispum wychmicini]TCO55809.1 DNA-binding transcriptional LysR family regulator [Actinocrispum wychmicini]
MELHQLRYLVAVVDQGSFTAAAEHLHVSQSGVSAQIAKLERELGTPLLERGPRHVRLSTAGTELLPLAREALRSIDTITERADELANLVRGRVRLGINVGCNNPRFLDAIAAFHNAHPGVEITFTEGATQRLHQSMAAGELDLALSGDLGDTPEGMRVTRIVDEQLTIITGPDHPLAGTHVRLRDVVEQTVLCLPVGSGIRAAFDRACALCGVSVKTHIDAHSPETIIGLVARGMGVGVLPESVAATSGLTVTPIADAEAKASILLVTRAGTMTPATRLLHAILTERLIQVLRPAPHSTCGY